MTLLPQQISRLRIILFLSEQTRGGGGRGNWGKDTDATVAPVDGEAAAETAQAPAAEAEPIEEEEPVCI